VAAAAEEPAASASIATAGASSVLGVLAIDPRNERPPAAPASEARRTKKG
jgi:hypothetical protein